MTDIRDSDALKAHIDSYLVGLKASMWANWFIDAADRRALAVEWVAELLHGLGVTEDHAWCDCHADFKLEVLR